MLNENTLRQIIGKANYIEDRIPGYAYKFIQKNRKAHPQAILETLEIVRQYLEISELKSFWGLVNKILPIKNGKWNAKDAERAHKELKAQIMDAGPELHDIASKVFGYL